MAIFAFLNNKTMVINHEYALSHFYHQIQFALDSYKSHGLSSQQFNHVLIGGLGGSGIGGRIARGYFLDKASLPIEVFSDYSLPKYANEKTLVILGSYSGETEETLAMYKAAQAKSCPIICISSGGTLSEWAQRDAYPLYTIEKGYQPRMALGFSLTYNLLILSELFAVSLQNELMALKDVYQVEAHQAKAQSALNLFLESLNHKYVLVTDLHTEAIGTRFAQQIQENAKCEAFVNVIPEANHNVFETYYGSVPSNFIFLNSRSNNRNNGRFAYLKQLLEKQGNLVYEMPVSANSIHDIYELIYTTDWFSILLSDQLGADNMSVPNISGLKSFLSTF